MVAIVAGLVLIISSDPPKSLCDAEVHQFKMGVRGFLYPNRDLKIYKGRYFEEFKTCQAGYSPGACIGLFDGIRKMLDVSMALSPKCLGQFGEEPIVREALFSTVDLMIRMAWGPTAPPATPAMRSGWLNPSDVHLYCRIKNRISLVYGESTWEQFREKYFTELPGSKGLQRQQVWEKSLLSTRCEGL